MKINESQDRTANKEKNKEDKLEVFHSCTLTNPTLYLIGILTFSSFLGLHLEPQRTQ